MVDYVPKDREARSLNEALSAEYDKLNAFWKKAEEQLAGIKVPVRCHHVYEVVDLDPEYESETCSALGWQFTLNGWRLCHGTFLADDPSDVQWRPILECSATERMRAGKYFPELRKKMIEEAKSYIEKVRQATDELESALKMR